MFEVTGDDIAQLSDSELRTLVARLALAELAADGVGVAGVTAGGNQDAPDGGLDVRVAGPVGTSFDFVPRTPTGFQVKRPDLNPAAIAKEMRPNGYLRQAISDLASEGGAYIIVSAQGTVADKPLQDREAAMRAAIADDVNAARLTVAYYDRTRLATWANCYPGVAAWTLARVGRGAAGWQAMGRWLDANSGSDNGYLVNDMACIADEGGASAGKVPILEGIARIRSRLRQPQSCTRLIGLSGLGKTRLVQALFENGVGEQPIDPGNAIYTDYSEDIEPSAREMARRLVEAGQRAVLIVDNCNPGAHSVLAQICSSPKSKVSLLTVEYDVRDDEPEATEVFRLEASSPELVERWLEGKFGHISQNDRGRIAGFSDGNFRVAAALAGTVGRGETLGKLKDSELFDRLFRQRNPEDRDLRLAAEDLALLYSVDGVNVVADSELAAIAQLRGATAAALYAAIADLKARGIAQSRGRWRAILPQALANPLADRALKRTPPAAFDAWCGSLSERMLKSLSRRLGYLHDSDEAKAAIVRWLQPRGPLGDLFGRGAIGVDIIVNIAPVVPAAVFAKIEAELDGASGPAIFATSNRERRRWISLLKALAYEPAMFEDAAFALARFVAAEPEDYRHDSARGPFGELFHLYLSGTLATPDQRCALIRRLAASTDLGLRRCAEIATDDLLESMHFTAMGSADFGARPRDWGWRPRTLVEQQQWFDEAIELASELAQIFPGAKAILGRNARSLWTFAKAHDALERVADKIGANGAWIDGWLSLRSALHFDAAGMEPITRTKLVALIDRIKPTGLLQKARAYVMSRATGSYDIADGDVVEGDDHSSAWRRASDETVSMGQAFAAEPALRRILMPEILIARHAMRAFQFGNGLAIGAADVAGQWTELLAMFRSAPVADRNITLLGGFICEVAKRDAALAARWLDAALVDPNLAPHLPWLQAQVGLDHDGIQRLLRALHTGAVPATSFSAIAYGILDSAPAEPLAQLIEHLAKAPGGSAIAVDVMHMAYRRNPGDTREIPEPMLSTGRAILREAEIVRGRDNMHEYHMSFVAEKCLIGVHTENDARLLCRRIRAALGRYEIHRGDIGQLLETIFKVQPRIALDEFLLTNAGIDDDEDHDFDLGRAAPVLAVDTEFMIAWADEDPPPRYRALGRAVPLFVAENDGAETSVSDTFRLLLDRAPDKLAFLGAYDRHMSPISWSGSLATVLHSRRDSLNSLASHSDASVRSWALDAQRRLELWAASELQRDSAKEESFE